MPPLHVPGARSPRRRRADPGAAVPARAARGTPPAWPHGPRAGAGRRPAAARTAQRRASSCPPRRWPPSRGPPVDGAGHGRPRGVDSELEREPERGAGRIGRDRRRPDSRSAQRPFRRSGFAPTGENVTRLVLIATPSPWRFPRASGGGFPGRASPARCRRSRFRRPRSRPWTGRAARRGRRRTVC